VDVQFRRLLRARIEKALERAIRQPRVLDAMIEQAVLEGLHGIVRREVGSVLEGILRNGAGFRGASHSSARR